MSRTFDLVIREAQLPDGRLADLGISGGRFAAIAPQLARSDNDLDASGRLLLAGLHDHHIHLLATAARQQSIDLSACHDADAIINALREGAAQTPPAQWLRAIGYDERVAGIPDRHGLDAWLPDRPLRVQDRTGALWLLNSAGVALLGDRPWPESVETDANGQPNGRIWRGDDWLRERIGHQPPSLRRLSRQLARYGVTAVTDAGANNSVGEAAIFADAVRSGALCQRLVLMGKEDLPQADVYALGAVKLLFDERALPDIAEIVVRICAARGIGRAVAAHCVTEAELLVFLAALEQAGGARLGDRIEHGSLIPHSLIADILQSGLTVAVNPGFIAHRGDRYLAEIDAVERPNLQRLASLSAHAVTLLGASDAPYGPVNPWLAIRAAIDRKTSSGAVLGAGEALSPRAALALFSDDRAIEIGRPADFCLAARDWAEWILGEDDPNPVHASFIGGQPQ